MALEVVLAIAGMIVVALVDTLLVTRVVRAYRKVRRAPHLAIAAGVAASYVAVLGVSIVFAATGEPELAGTVLFEAARWLSFVGAALAYGLVGVFAALAFGGSRAATALSWLALAGLVTIAALAAHSQPTEVSTPATMDWALRVPFIALSLGGSLFGAVTASLLARAYATAARAGRSVDPAALGRMRIMSAGFFAMAVSQLAIGGFTPRGSFVTPLGLCLVTVILLGALLFTLGCIATWATPELLRARWKVGP